LDDKRNAAEEEYYYTQKELQAHDDAFKELELQINPPF